MIVLLGLLNHPVFSTMLLLVAGILVGYAVCYPFRADASGVPEQLEQVQEQNATLQAALDEQRNSYSRLEQKHTEQRQEWIELRDSHNDLTTAWEKFGANYSQVGSELQNIQDLTSDSAETVKYERAERRVVEKALVQAEDKIDDLRQQVSSLAERKDDGTKLQIRLDEAHQHAETFTQQLATQANEHATGLEDVRAQNSELTLELKNCQRQRTELDEAFSSQNRELTMAKSECLKLRNAELERTQLVGAIGARREQVRKLEAERDEARAAEHQIQRQLEQIKSVSRDRDEELAELQRQREENAVALEQQQQDVGKLDDIVAEHEAIIQKLTTERNAALAAQHDAEKITAQLEQQTNENKQLQARCHRALADVQREQAARQEFEAALDASQDEINVLRQRCLTLQNATEEKEMVQTALDDGRRRLQQLSIERDAAFAAEVAAKETVTDLQQATQRNSHDVDRLRQQREEVLTELKVTQSDREQLTRELKQREQKIATLQATCDKLTAHESDREALAERLSNQAERLRKISLEHELTAASLGQAEQTIDDLRQLIDSREQTIDDLQRERDEVDGGLAGQSVQESAENTRIDPRLGTIYVHEPAFKDDLKQISGVVESFEKKLNDFGVYTYKQIMDWDDSAIEAFSDLLAFKDRISREDWVAQARRLHSQAHGRAA